LPAHTEHLRRVVVKRQQVEAMLRRFGWDDAARRA
jgi:hypothetical protein